MRFRALLAVGVGLGAAMAPTVPAGANPPEGPTSCLDPATANSWLRDLFSEHDALGGPGGPRLEVRFGNATCGGDACQVDFRLEPAQAWGVEVTCRWTAPLEPREGNVVAVGDRTFQCTVPRDACEAVWGEETAREARRLVEASCLQPARAIASRSLSCTETPVEPISDPVAPTPERARLGFDVGLLWVPAADRLGPLGLAAGAAWDVVLGDGFDEGERLLVGARLGYLGVPGRRVDVDGDGVADRRGPTLHALDPGVRVRLGLGRRRSRWELEGSLAYRLTLSDADDDQLAAGAAIHRAWRGFGLGLRYEHSLEASATRHTLVLVTERTSAPPSETGAGETLPRVGLGLHALVAGWALADGLGYLLPGVAVELPVYFGGPLLAPFVRWDLLWSTGGDDDAIALQTLLAGVQYFHISGADDRGLPFGLAASGGYGLAHGRSPRAVEAGPVADVGAWWFLRDLYYLNVGLDLRVGLAHDNRDLRAVFLSFGAREVKW